MRGRLVLGAIAALLIVPATAGARDFGWRPHAPLHLTHRARVSGARLSPLALAQAAAVQYWGGQPCGGAVTITYTAELSAPTSATDGVAVGTIWALTTFDTPEGPLAWSAPPSTYTRCVVTVNEAAWPVSEQVRDFPQFCALIVHEYGHLFGHPDHAADPPTSIIYPLIGLQNERVRPCVARYRHARTNG